MVVTWLCVAVDTDWTSAAGELATACQNLEDNGAEVFSIQGPAIKPHGIAGPERFPIHFVVVGRKQQDADQLAKEIAKNEHERQGDRVSLGDGPADPSLPASATG